MKNKKLESAIILFSLWLLMFASSSQFFIISPILTQIGTQLDIPQALRGTLITAYAITLGITALITGPLSDRYGRRKILVFGSAAMAAALLLHSFAVDYYSMLSFRILSGFAGGILTGSCVAYVGDYYPFERRGWANGVVATGSAAGQVLGIPAGTLLSGSIGFYAPFQVFGLIMAVAFFMILWQLPEPNVKKSDCGLTIKETIKNYWLILQIPSVKTIAMSYLLMFFSFTVFVVYFPTWMEEHLHVSHYEIALLFLVGGIATVFAGPLSGKISDRWGRKQILIFTNLLLVIAIPMSIFLLGGFPKVYYPVFFLIMTLMVARRVPFQTLAAESVESEIRGRMMSLTISIGQLGMALGSAIAGFIYSEIDFMGNATLAAIACMLMAGMIQQYIKESEPSATTKSAAIHSN